MSVSCLVDVNECRIMWKLIWSSSFYFRSKCWTSKPSGCYEEDLVSNFKENEDELDANSVELANLVANEEQTVELWTNLEEVQLTCSFLFRFWLKNFLSYLEMISYTE